MRARKALAVVILSVASMREPQHAVGLSSHSYDQRDRPAPSGLLFRATTTIVQFDAQVFDSDGRPIVSLTRDDFDVLQDGVPVVITDVAFIARGFRGGAGAGPVAPDLTWAPLVFLVDDMAMTAAGFQRVRDGLRAFVERGLPAGVEVGILRTGERGWRTTTLSADRRVLLARIDGMKYLLRSFRRGLTSGSGAAGPEGHGIERPFAEGTLGSLTSLLGNLRRLPGRKVVVLVSEGVTLDVTAEDNAGAPVEERMNRLGQLAAVAGVTTHCIDAAGVEMTSLKDGLVSTAERLGGLYLGGGNDLTAAFVHLANVEAGYYLLSYVPPPGTFVAGRPAPFRRLTVRVRGRQVDVRTRRGFFGADDR